MPQPNYGLDPYASEAAEIERTRRYAEAMRDQAGSQIQPYSVGGMTAPISWTQGAAKLLQGYNAGAAGRDAEARAKALQGKVQADAMRWYGEQPQEGQPRAMPTDQERTGSFDMSGTAGPLVTSSAPSKQEMMGWLMRGGMNPMTAPMAQAMMAQQIPKRPEPFTLAPGAVRYDENGKQVAVAPHKPDKPAAAPSAIQEYEYAQKQGFKGSFQDFELQKRKAGATNVMVSQSTEKKYGEQFAGKIAGADSDMRDAAIKAPELADRSNRIKEALASGKITTGFGADYRLAFGKALGLAGASDVETLKNTETLVAELASNTMDAIKASGMGGGTGFSNADRDFLEKAKGGKITLEASTINRLADLSHKAAALSADRWNKRVKQIPKSALEGTGITQEDVKVPSLFAGGKPPMYAVNPQTKQRIMSTDGGSTWGPAQ